MSERQKMLSGALYDAMDTQLVRERVRARELTKTLNETSAGDPAERDRILAQLFGAIGHNVAIEPPFYCDYGHNIFVGSDVFINFNCIILDASRVDIGDRVLFGPSVQIYAATHPLEVQTRRRGLELAKPVWIGPDVWVGGGAILLAGVRIGAASVIGAGSVVTRDIPEQVLAVGNPCRVVRPL
jgi:maltose O-acetyltransferase